jgi:hypothetical protein
MVLKADGVLKDYDWDKITEEVEKLYISVRARHK